MRLFNLESALSFVGNQQDVDQYLSRARIFCLTSYYEGLPIAALEAMAHGLPVLSLSYPGADELIQPSVTGFICATPQELSAQAVKLLQDPAQRIMMGKNAQEFVRREHGEENLTKFVQQFWG